jgi:hypothetical protein
MTPTAYVLLGMAIVVAGLIPLFHLGERMRRTRTIDQDDYKPTHKVNGDTRKLARPPRINLTPEPGDTEWKFPPR